MRFWGILSISRPRTAMVRAILACILLVGLGCAAISEDEVGKALQNDLKKSHLSLEEMTRLRQMKPLLDYPNIMFWRPQKVGSSTILSLLVSFGYRYNILQRRRSIGANFICRKIASCAYADMESNGAKPKATRGKWGEEGAGLDDMGTERFLDTLKHYIGGGNWPMLRADGSVAPTKKSSRGPKQHTQERLSEYIGPYHVSTDHNMCFLDQDIIKNYLPCAFVQLDQASELGSEQPTKRALRAPLLQATNTSTSTTRLLEQTRQQKPQVKELFAVRHPMKRIISIYYFWGELFKVKYHRERNKKGLSDGERGSIRIGGEAGGAQTRGLWDSLSKRHKKHDDVQGYAGSLFRYHGNESTVPSDAIAEEFAERVILFHGMPGPSATSAAFAQSAAGTAEVVMGDRIMTVVVERMVESLVVSRHYLGWSLADVVVVSPRKALSQHPGYDKWPTAVVDRLRRKLENAGEFKVYDAANSKLDQRIVNLEAGGKVSVTAEVEVLKALQARVGPLCLSTPYLHLYRAWMSGKAGVDGGVFARKPDWVLPLHYSDNKLRDSDQYYSDEGHTFDFNRDKIISYDLCGACESHAIMSGFPDDALHSTGGIRSAADAKDLVKRGTLLKDLRRKDVQGNPHFKHCPVGVTM